MVSSTLAGSLLPDDGRKHPSDSATQPILEVAFKQLQTETLGLATACVAGGGLAVLSTVPNSRDPMRAVVTAMLLLGLAGIAWLLRGKSFATAAVLLVSALLGGIGLGLAWGGDVALICLLAIPAGLAMLMLGKKAGLGLAVALTLLVYMSGAWLPTTWPELRAIAVVGLWASVGMVWLTLRPLLTAVEWAWSHYEQAETALEQARDSQMLLKQTLADLSTANVQLTRLNQLAQGLRAVAEEARRVKQEFVANVSHELRTPLNMIIGFSRMIVQNPAVYGNQVPSALLADLTVILRNSQHLANLIEDVLDLSQIEAGKMALTKERCDLAEIIETAVTVVRPLFESKQLYLQVETQPDLPAVYCDSTRIREVILNLLSNAGRFTERGGVVLRAVEVKSDLLISVSDTGPGIAEQDQPRLFRSFQQLDSSLRRIHGGTGLGLALSKQFVELHGGRMWLESTVGTGSTFHFTLPVNPPAAGQATFRRWLKEGWGDVLRTHRSLAPVRPVRPRLVVMDENGVLQRLTERYLDGFEVESVDSLEAAVQALDRAPGQALLVGKASGNEMWGLAIPQGLPDGIPVITCSLPPARPTTAPGASDYLVKPVSQEALINAIELALGGEASTETQTGQSRDGAPAAVLLVDDEPDELRLFWRMLASAGRRYRVLTAHDGYEALQIMATERPDVVVTDLLMPGMDGFQLMATKAADPALQHIPLVVISARDPNGQPIVAQSLAVTRAGGLTVPQLLACVEDLSAILSPLAAPTSQELLAEPLE